MASSSPVTMSYKVFEPASGADDSVPPVIFLHGITASKEDWSNIPQLVADDTKRKAYALDARNHGDSEWSDDFNMDLLADDLFHFMDTMAISKAVLIGHSMGGKISIRAALEKPEKFEMVFIEDIYVRRLDSDRKLGTLGLLLALQEAVSVVPPELDSEEASVFVVEQVKKLLAAPLTNTKVKFSIPLKRGVDGSYCLKLNAKALIEVLSNGDNNATSLSGVYTSPTYFIYGSESPFQVFKEEENIRKFFPRAEFLKVEGAGHIIHGEFPAKFTEIVLGLFKK